MTTLPKDALGEVQLLNRRQDLCVPTAKSCTDLPLAGSSLSYCDLSRGKREFSPIVDLNPGRRIERVILN